MNEIIDFKLAGHYKVWVKFQDGFENEVDIGPLIGKGFTAELLEKKEFNKVRIESGGGLAWENGFDICPNYLRELATQDVQIEHLVDSKM